MGQMSLASCSDVLRVGPAAAGATMQQRSGKVGAESSPAACSPSTSSSCNGHVRKTGSADESSSAKAATGTRAPDAFGPSGVAPQMAPHQVGPQADPRAIPAAAGPTAAAAAAAAAATATAAAAAAAAAAATAAGVKTGRAVASGHEACGGSTGLSKSTDPVAATAAIVEAASTASGSVAPTRADTPASAHTPAPAPRRPPPPEPPEIVRLRAELRAKEGALELLRGEGADHPSVLEALARLHVAEASDKARESCAQSSSPTIVHV